MLFGTEKEAKTFLKFNGEAVNPDGTRRMRVYRCPCCCGWHISSHPYNGNSITEDVIQAYRAENDGGEPIIRANQLADELSRRGFATRKAVNKYLKGVEIPQRVKDMARLRYYKISGI